MNPYGIAIYLAGAVAAWCLGRSAKHNHYICVAYAIAWPVWAMVFWMAAAGSDEEEEEKAE